MSLWNVRKSTKCSVSGEQLAKFLGHLLPLFVVELHRWLRRKIERVSKPWATKNDVQNRTGCLASIRSTSMDHSIVHQIRVALLGEWKTCLRVIRFLHQPPQLFDSVSRAMAPFPNRRCANVVADIDQRYHHRQRVNWQIVAKFF